MNERTIPIVKSIMLILFVSFFSGCGEETDDTKPDPTLPILTTTTISDIRSRIAVSGGNITSDGGADITARGVCWSISASPTTSDTKSSNGPGAGIFTSNITSLITGTTYYVRAYATNSVGTAYGNELSFTTAACGTTVTDIDANTYNVVSIGNQCWLKENLKTGHYKNGDPIPTGLSSSAWSTTT